MKSTKNIIKIESGQETSKTLETMNTFMSQLWTADNSNPLFMMLVSAIIGWYFGMCYRLQLVSTDTRMESFLQWNSMRVVVSWDQIFIPLAEKMSDLK